MGSSSGGTDFSSRGFEARARGLAGLVGLLDEVDALQPLTGEEAVPMVGLRAKPVQRLKEGA